MKKIIFILAVAAALAGVVAAPAVMGHGNSAPVIANFADGNG